MTNIEIKQLVNYNRFPDNESKILLAILYLPFGIILFLLRCIVGLTLLILGQVLPDSPLIQSFLNNITCICFGIFVSVENSKTKENVEVYISNNVSVFDHVAVAKAIGTILPLNKTPLQSLPAMGITDLGSINNDDDFRKSLEAITAKKTMPIFFSPEEYPTNGKALLKFNSKYFNFFQKIQPICISVKRPFLDISISALGSTWQNDLFYFMLSPFTNYSIKFLPSMEKKSLSGDEFADIVCQKIAAELKVDTTDFSASDVSEWSKRQIAEEKRRNQIRASAQQFGQNLFPNHELSQMATQVKEVLPHVPISAIYNDLAITRSVDTTITNILEGRVRFIPETPTAGPSSTVSPTNQSGASTSPKLGTTSNGMAPSPSQLSMAASSFGKTATERARSFQERKEQLIAAARRRYIEKHNLDIPV